MDSLDEANFVQDYNEYLYDVEDKNNNSETISVSQQKPNKKSKLYKCNVCEQSDTHLRRHVVRKHLPWWFEAATACWSCKVQEGHKSFLKKHEHDLNINEEQWQEWCNALLLAIQEDLEFTSLQELLKLIVKNELHTKVRNFHPEEQVALHKLAECFKLETPETVVANPPNCTVAVLHWETLSNLLSKLSCRITDDFTKFEPNISTKLEAPNKQNIIDTHAHLDMLLSRKNLAEYEQSIISESNVTGIVASFVYPEHWPDYISIQLDKRIKSSFGIHPHLLKNYRQLRSYTWELEQMVESESCIALGEIGLDFMNTSRKCIDVQYQFLEHMLTWLRFQEKVLILHCRDYGDGIAAERVLNLLCSMGLQGQKIHRHCFTGGVLEATNWVEALPNCFFGVTTTLFHSKDTHILAISHIPIDRLLLESDCPYLASSPWDLVPIAKEISFIKKLSTATVIETCNKNDINLYGPF